MTIPEQSTTWTLDAHPPFSLPAVIRSHGWIRLAPFREEAAGLSYVTQLPEGRVLALEIGPAEGGVRIAASSTLGPQEQETVSRQVRWMLGLDQDLSSFYAMARQEPQLAHVIERGQGRVLRSATLFEDAVKTILTTNTTWSGTIRMVENLVAGLGAPLPDDPARRAFPTPEALAAVDVETLRGQVRLGYRAPYVRDLARTVATGELDLEALKETDEPSAELYRRLRGIKGVGPYAAAHLMLLLECYDVLPIDSWAIKLVSREWFGGAPIGRAEVEAAFARWGEWKTLAFWFWNWTPHPEP